MSKKLRKKSFIGFAPTDWDVVVWTVYNQLNIAFVIHKTKHAVFQV